MFANTNILNVFTHVNAIHYCYYGVVVYNHTVAFVVMCVLLLLCYSCNLTAAFLKMYVLLFCSHLAQ